MSDTITIKIDGQELECRPGEKVLEVALRNGIHIPHYCWHPGLTVAGNCRMCLCKSNKAPKPVISCSTDCVPELEIDTQSDEVKEMQEAIMEFLLINHPLDCPVCDQAGECRLQDYAHEYGRAKGRFREEKRVKPDTVVGPGVALWKQRCIACSRCIRFCDEISGTGELRFLQRGDRVEIETFPGVPLDNPLAGNVVDLCPVGALVSRDFLFEARVWNMTRAPSVCPGCSRGCNVHVDVLDTKWDEPTVKRLVPRENADVNQWWMCDHGRAEVHALHRVDDGDGGALVRLRSVQERRTAGAEEGGSFLAESSAEAAVEQLAAAFERHRGRLAIIGNLWQTTEEMHLVAKLAASLDAPVGLLERPEGEEIEFPTFRIAADKNPNRAGAQIVFDAKTLKSGLADVVKSMQKGDVGAAIVFAGLPHHELSPELLSALDGLPDLFVVGLFEDAIAQRATWLLPGVSWAEKDGTYVNEDGRLQRLARSFDSPGIARADLDYLQAMLRAAGELELDGVSAAGIFKLAADEVGALSGLSYPGRGSSGATVKGKKKSGGRK